MNETQRLEEVASFVVGEAKRLGSTGSSVTIVCDDSVETTVRMGEVEQLQGAQSRHLTLQVYVGQNGAVAKTSDLRRRQLTRFVRSTIAMARQSEPDPFAGLPAAEELAASIPDLQLIAGGLAELDVAARIDMALAAEQAALAFDPRIKNSEGASFSDSRGAVVLANSLGFVGSYEHGYCALNVAVVGEENGEMQVESGWSQARSLKDLKRAEEVGQEAARRAIARLGARKVPTQDVPVIFDRRMAARFMRQVVSALDGYALVGGRSFLAGRLGETIATSRLTIVDDGLIPGGLGSRPFDAEGLPSRRREIVSAGKLCCYLLDSYAARNLSLTANGGRTSNLYIEPGHLSPEEIIASVESGLYLTGVSGPGFNPVTGDYSVGATGIWIEKGKLALPVHEITIASDVLSMLANLEAIGDDLIFDSASCSPTLKIGSMTVAGQ